MPIVTAARQSLVDSAYQALTQAIFDGTFAPGSQVHIGQLAEMLDISITPMREALSRAAAQRLLIHSANRGFQVAPLLTDAEHRSLFATRTLIESAAVPQIADPVATAERLQVHVEAMKAAAGGPSFAEFSQYTTADGAFHRTLVAAADSPFLTIAWESLYLHLHVSRLYSGAGVVDAGSGLAEHNLIVAALRDGDKKAALAALLAHVRSAESRMHELLLAAEGGGQRADG
jgi:DNA-binding GntR family transcriptional regulator